MPDSPDRPLRVLVLATTFPARSGDGTPEFVLTLSSGLAATGAEVTAVVPRVPGGVAEEVMDGVQVRRFAYFPERWEGLADGAIMPNLRAEPWRWAEAPPLVWRLYQAAAKEIRRQRPDVVHAHWIVPAGLVASMLHRRHRLPFVITAHGADAYTLRGRATSRLKRAALQAAEATVPVSEIDRGRAGAARRGPGPDPDGRRRPADPSRGRRATPGGRPHPVRRTAGGEEGHRRPRPGAPDRARCAAGHRGRRPAARRPGGSSSPRPARPTGSRSSASARVTR